LRQALNAKPSVDFSGYGSATNPLQLDKIAKANLTGRSDDQYGA
jgi:hypothetical protein